MFLQNITDQDQNAQLEYFYYYHTITETGRGWEPYMKGDDVLSRGYGCRKLTLDYAEALQSQ